MSRLQDSDLRKRVIDELDWDPAIDPGAIAVAAKEGAVMLSGTVANDSQKLNAERTVKRVFGVKAVAEDLTSRVPSPGARSSMRTGLRSTAAMAR
jgi:osmotically-inducible protein OsmY